jgi:hypothetical protein
MHLLNKNYMVIYVIFKYNSFVQSAFLFLSTKNHLLLYFDSVSISKNYFTNRSVGSEFPRCFPIDLIIGYENYSLKNSMFRTP